MDYAKIYNNLVNKWKNINLPAKTKGTHKHHIVAKSLGGSDDKSNYVIVPYRVHFVLHRLYAKFDTTGKMLIALSYMLNSHYNKDIKVTSHTYANVFKDLSVLQSKRMTKMYADPKAKEEWLKTVRTEEYRKKRSTLMKGKKPNPEIEKKRLETLKSPEYRKKSSEIQKNLLRTGKIIITEERKRKHLESIKSGKDHPNYDHTIRTFKNSKTNEVFIGTTNEFYNKYGLSCGNVCGLIKGIHKSVKGWSYHESNT